MYGRSLRKRALILVALTATVIAALLALCSNRSALAASPSAQCNSPSAQVISCHFTDSFADTDYCGTGQTVDLAFEGRFTVPAAPSTSGGSWNNSESRAVLTNPATGETVLIHSAYRFMSVLISGDPNGVHTVQARFAGDAETIRDDHGGVLARDAGNLVIEATFDGGDFVTAEVVSDHGDHSLFGNGDCGVLVSALGLT
jgi:hypothetical protein